MNTKIEQAIVLIRRKVDIREKDVATIREVLTALAADLAPVTVTPNLTAEEISLIRDAFKAKIA